MSAISVRAVLSRVNDVLKTLMSASGAAFLLSRGGGLVGSVADELQLLAPLQDLGRDHPGPAAAGPDYFARGASRDDRGGRATDHPKEAEARLGRRVKERAQEAAGSIADLRGRARARCRIGPAPADRSELGQCEKCHDDVSHARALPWFLASSPRNPEQGAAWLMPWTVEA